MQIVRQQAGRVERRRLERVGKGRRRQEKAREKETPCKLAARAFASLVKDLPLETLDLSGENLRKM